MSKGKAPKVSALKNNLFLLSLVYQASPGRIPLLLLLMTCRALRSFLNGVYLLRLVVNGVQTGLSFEKIAVFILVVAGFNLLVDALQGYFEELFVPRSDKDIFAHIQKKVFAQAVAVELACFEDPAFYDKYVKTVEEAATRAGQVLTTLGYVVNGAVTVCSASFMALLIDPVLILFALLPVAAGLLFGKRLNKARYDRRMEMQERERQRDYVKRVFYLGDYAKELRLTNIHRVLLHRLESTIQSLKETIHGFFLKISVPSYLLEFTNDVLVYLGATLYAAYQTLVTGKMLFGDCLVVLNTLNSLAWALREVINLLVQFQGHALYIENLRSFLEHRPAIAPNPQGPRPEGHRLLEVEKLCFRYPGQQTDQLHDLSLHLAQGEKIALVGLNGAGKTTLIKLLLRLYEPTSGSIRLNGQPLDSYQLQGYRELFGVVFQDYRLFSLDVLQNVLLKGNPTAQDAQAAREGLEASGLGERVARMAKGEKTILTREFDEQGEVLSGGEAQKLAIARIFARPCPIAILDEPTSALDPVAEYHMYQTMMQACADKAVILIFHRLSSAVLADRIYLLENGSIAEQGSHAQLLKQKGRYADMWAKQAESYREGGLPGEAAEK